MENRDLLQKIEALEKKINAMESSRGIKGFLNRAFTRTSVLAGAAISALLTGVILYAAQITFNDGTIISAADVNSNFSDLNTRLQTLEAKSLDTRLQTIETKFTGVTRTGNVIQFSGVNVQIVSGSGTTAGTINGLGNLIVGYNEARATGSLRTGSHNIILGTWNNYSSYGGIVAGYYSTISGQYASVSGGYYNTASGICSSVSGGSSNIASASYTSVSGGSSNTASASYASVSGGNVNTASGEASSISGGGGNTASGYDSSISGGTSNTASNFGSSVSGGVENISSGNYTSVSGGIRRSAIGNYTWVGGTYTAY